jgi:hypothetical protein
MVSGFLRAGLGLLNMAKPKVIFVLGAPGAGKGTQCQKIVDVSPVDMKNPKSCKLYFRNLATCTYQLEICFERREPSRIRSTEN